MRFAREDFEARSARRCVINMNDRYSNEETPPGAPSSKYHGVFRRGHRWEVAITLHPDLQDAKMHKRRFRESPLSIYVVRGCTHDEEQAALAYDHHVVTFLHEMKDYAWPHFNPPRRMTWSEIRMYSPWRIKLNFGPRGVYEHTRAYERRRLGKKCFSDSDSD